MKKIYYIPILAISLSGFVFLLFSGSTQIDTADEQWETFEKKGDQLHSYPTKVSEKKKLKLPEILGNRKPANSADVVKFDNLPARELTGQTNIEGKSLEYQNQIQKEWKKLLSENLLHHQIPGTKIYIKQTNSYLHVHKSKAWYREEVAVTLTLPNGKRGDFKALIDSNTGKVLNTWDRSYEHQGTMPSKPNSFAPQGQL